MKDDSLRETTEMAHLSVGITSFNPRLNADDSLAGIHQNGALFRGYHFVQPTAKRRRFPCGNPQSLMAFISWRRKSDGFYPRSGDNPNLAVG